MAKFVSDRTRLVCSFCGKDKKQASKLIAGPDVYICNECVDLCNEIIVEEAGEVPARRRPGDEEIEAATRAVHEAVSRLRSLALRRQYPPEQPPTG